MNNSNYSLQIKSKFRRLGFFIVANLLMVVMVGKGVMHLSNGASAGYVELLLGSVFLICMPWIQDNVRDVKPEWEAPFFFVFLMGLFAASAFFSMVNPFI